MKTKYLLHPLNLFWFPALCAVVMWWLTPIEWFNKSRVPEKIDIFSLLLPASVGFVCFYCGHIAASYFYKPRQFIVEPAWERHTFKWVMTLGMLLAGISMAALVLIVGGSAGVGGLVDVYALRHSYVGGVTTFVHIGTAVLVLAGVWVLTMKKLDGLALWAVLACSLFALHRGFLAAERLAVLVPVCSLSVVWITLRVERLTPKLVSYAVLAVSLVLAMFIVGEYFRSYSEKMYYGHQIEESPVSYGFQRFVLYYALSLNAAGGQYQLYTEDAYRSIFLSQTCTPLASFLYDVVGIQPIILGAGQSLDDGRLASLGFYNREFNNKWGVIMPLLENWWVGGFFWCFWGVVGTILYKNVFDRRPDAFDLALFGLFVAAFIDNQTRVGLLAAVHFLAPFYWMALMAWFARRMYRRQMVLRDGGTQAITTRARPLQAKPAPSR